MPRKLALIGALAVGTALGAVPFELVAQQFRPPASASDTSNDAPRPGRAAAVLASLSQDLQTLSHAVEPAVVKIYATGLAPVSDEPGKASFLAQQRMLGAGAIMDPNGYILTNAHVVAHARSLSVLVTDTSDAIEEVDDSRIERPATAVPATIVGLDAVSDIAVIKIDRKNLRSLHFGNSDRVHPGELVLAFGSPLGLQDSVSLGVVSAVNRQLDPESPMVYLQTDAAINPGNSGGPLIDMEGDLIGVNSMIESQSGGNEGLGFSIPANTARVVYEQIIKYGHARRGTVGIFPTNITPTLAKGLGLPRESGVLVQDVVPDSPAAKIGLKVGDILTTLNGQPLLDTRQLAVHMFRQRPGEVLHLGVLKGSVVSKIDVTVEESKRDAASLIDPSKAEQYVVPRLGILALPISADIAEAIGDQRQSGGLVVVAKTFGVASDLVDLRVGDILYSANQIKLDSLDTLKDFMKSLKPGDPAVIQVERDGLLSFVAFRYDD